MSKCKTICILFVRFFLKESGNRFHHTNHIPSPHSGYLFSCQQVVAETKEVVAGMTAGLQQMGEVLFGIGHIGDRLALGMPQITEPLQTMGADAGIAAHFDARDELQTTHIVLVVEHRAKDILLGGCFAYR